MTVIDFNQIQPGMRVRIGPELLGEALYGAYDPQGYVKYLGQEATVLETFKSGDLRYVRLDSGADDCTFLIEEIECIIDDVEIPESEESIADFLGIEIKEEK
jgi:hypothetical protein